VRRLARTLQTGAGGIDLPRQTSGTTAYWVGELEDRTESEMTFGVNSLPLHELATYIDVSVRLLDDAEIDILSILYEDLARAFAEAEGVAFVGGNGVKKPTGVLADPALVKVASGHATELTADGLIGAVYAVPAMHRRNATWLMSNATAATVRKMKSATDGTYLWQDQGRLIAGQPATLLGYPVETDENLPGVAASALPILFGDFRAGYFVIDKANGLSILRDPFTMATKGLVRFHARMRVGGGLVRPAALRAVRVSAS
jgi:HK97 family phage major capsid protein